MKEWHPEFAGYKKWHIEVLYGEYSSLFQSTIVFETTPKAHGAYASVGNLFVDRSSIVGKKEGYNFKVKVHKTDESNVSLSGAVFEVVRKATNKVVGTITTDADGNAEVGNLLRDTYILRETTAPAGYDRLTEDITISPTDFGKTLNVGSPASGDSGDSRLVAVNVVNKQTQIPGDKKVTFSKVNLGGTEIAGAEIKIYKGEKAEGNY